MTEYFPFFHSYGIKLRKLSDQELGRLVRALLKYSETGEEEQLAGRESMAFDFIAADIDRAKATYVAKSESNRRNAEARYKAGKGLPKTPEEPARTGAGERNSGADSSDGLADLHNSNACDGMRTHAMACDGSERMRPDANAAKEKEKQKQKENILSSESIIAPAPAREKTKRFLAPSLADVQEYCRERGNSVDAQRFVDYYTANGWMVGKSKMKDWKAAVRNWEASERSYGPKRSTSPYGPKAGGVVTASDPGQVDPLAFAAIQRMMAGERED